MGRLAFVATLALLGAGCAQLLGLDTTTGAGSAVTPDAPPGTVNLEVTRLSVGASITTAPQDLTGLPVANWLVADPSDPTQLMRVAGKQVAPDTWEATIADGNPPVEFTLGSDYPDEYRRLIALPQRNLKFLYGIYEHPDPVAIPAPPDSFAVNMTLASPYATGDSFYVEAIGGWGYHPFNGAELPAPDMGLTAIAATETYAPYDGTTGAGFVPWSGRPLDALTTGDTLIGLHYRASGLIGAGEFPAFAEGSAASISETMVGVTTAPLDVMVNPATVNQRLQATRPAGGGVAMSWAVVAAPGYATASGLGPTLNSAAVVATDPGMITAPYGNPFASRGWNAMFEWVSSNNRSVTLAGGGAAYVATSGGLQDFAEVSSGLSLMTPAPLPITISVNGTALVADNMTVAMDLSKPVTLELEADTNATPTLYQFNVYNLVLDATSNTWGAHVAYVAMCSANSVTIPNDVFVAGNVYMIRGHTFVGGFPNLATGDFTTRQLPYSLGYLDGGIFTVMASGSGSGSGSGAM
ncbi:MAG TPA: hypothetical protein VH143_03815 [Kofleriaceae bacterium]|nr:hypothetical protein [Kofleriaceae bacterium]